MHASHVMKELHVLDPSARFAYLGGDNMMSVAGNVPLIHISEMSVMGISQVISALPRLLAQLETAKRAIRRVRPDAACIGRLPVIQPQACRLCPFLGYSGCMVYFTKGVGMERMASADNEKGY